MNTYVNNLAEQLVPMGNGYLAQELDVAGTVVTPTALGPKATHALVSVKGNDVLVTFDGTDPASGGAGALLAVDGGAMYPWPRDRVKAARFIEAVGGSAGVVRIEPMAMG